VPTTDPGAFDVARAMAHDRALAVEIGRRDAGLPGAARAADYIEAELAKLGMRVERQTFPLPQGGVSWNVIGFPRGFSEQRPYLITGGHYDTRDGPGANDNGTGIAAALETMRTLSAHALALPVVFVAFGAEEIQPVPGTGHHHYGSRYYVAHMSPDARRNLVAFVNLDMVGVGPVVLCMRTADGPREGTLRCVRKGVEIGVPTKETVTPDWSDNGSFLRTGLNAAALWSGDQTCCNHTPSDTIDRVQPDAVGRAGRLAVAILRSYTR
jgi:Zn-dependent M28 family amino/carboxypeptidase